MATSHNNPITSPGQFDFKGFGDGFAFTSGHRNIGGSQREKPLNFFQFTFRSTVQGISNLFAGSRRHAVASPPVMGFEYAAMSRRDSQSEARPAYQFDSMSRNERRPRKFAKLRQCRRKQGDSKQSAVVAREVTDDIQLDLQSLSLSEPHPRQGCNIFKFLGLSGSSLLGKRRSDTDDSSEQGACLRLRKRRKVEVDDDNFTSTRNSTKQAEHPAQPVILQSEMEAPRNAAALYVPNRHNGEGFPDLIDPQAAVFAYGDTSESVGHRLDPILEDEGTGGSVSPLNRSADMLSLGDLSTVSSFHDEEMWRS